MGVLRATQSGQDQNWATKGKWYLYCMFQTNSSPPLYLDETFAITGGEGLNPKLWLKRILFLEKLATIRLKLAKKRGWTYSLANNLGPTRANKEEWELCRKGSGGIYMNHTVHLRSIVISLDFTLASNFKRNSEFFGKIILRKTSKTLVFCLRSYP